MELVVDFSGWCRIDADKVNLMDCTTGDVKTAAEWMAERGDIDGLILESLTDAMDNADDLEYSEIDLTIESEDDDEIGS